MRLTGNERCVRGIRGVRSVQGCIPALFAASFSAAPALAQCQLPLVVHPAPGAADRAGQSVAAHGALLLLGAPMDDTPTVDAGSALVYELLGASLVHRVTLQRPEGASTGDQFGRAVALAGNLAAVGAHLDDTASQDTGSVSIFSRSGSGAQAEWSFQTILTPTDTAASDLFGFSVALWAAGATGTDRLISGTHGRDAPGKPDAGAAYIFERSGSAWAQAAKLTPSDPLAAAYFGAAVAIAGDLAVVGAWGHDGSVDGVGAVGAEAGAAYIFRRQNDGAWNQEARLTPAEPLAPGDRFGLAVAIGESGTVVIGAPMRDGQGLTDSGAAFVFEFEGGAWMPKAVLARSSAAAGDQFGAAVANAGTGVLVGVPRADATMPNRADSGEAVLFRRAGASWTVEQVLAPAAGAAGDEAGSAVALTGAMAVMGARGRDAAALTDSGAAWVWALAGPGAADCNFNGVPDPCDLLWNTSKDCDSNGVPDECLPTSVLSTDCNANGIPDACELQGNAALDCDRDGVLDACQIAMNPALDCDGDGVLDLCATHPIEFFAPLTATADDTPVTRLFAADLNGDGLPEIVMLAGSSGRFSVLRKLADAPGYAAAVERVATTAATRDLRAAAALDVDDDGDNDLAIADAVSPGKVYIIRNAGDGTFPAAPPTALIISVGNRPLDVAAADLSGDGKPDLVTANADGNSLSVVLNTTEPGSASPVTFAAAVTITCPGAPERVMLADLDGDGDLDIVALTRTGSEVRLHLNDGVGVFGPARVFTVGASVMPLDMQVADLNGDGRLDVVTHNSTPRGVSVLFNLPGADGGPVLTSPMVWPSPAPDPARRIQVADVDRDGDMDIVGLAFSPSPMVQVLRNEGAGFFAQAMVTRPIALASIGNHSIALDADGDGSIDLAFNAGAGIALVRGRFEPLAPDCNNNSVPDSCDPDSDGDGTPDGCVPPPPACPADADGSGQADVPDIFLFLGWWFEGNELADFDGVDGVGVNDIFSFLAAWFAGCS